MAALKSLPVHTFNALIFPILRDCLQKTNLLPPKPKSSSSHLKQGIQEFHRKYVFVVPADNDANNVVVVCRLHYINTLKQELDGTRAYKETDSDEISVVNAHLNELPVKFSVCVNEGQDKLPTMYWLPKLHKRPYKKVQVGKDQEKAQSERDSHSKNRGGKKTNQQSGTYTMKHIVSRMSSYFPNRWPLSYLVAMPC